MPVCVETLGTWGQNAIKFIKEVGKKVQDETGEQRSTSFLIQSIGIAVQRGNAVSIMGTVENSKALDEVFYILN